MVISGCSHKLETQACNITKASKIEVMHITLEPGIYEIVNGKIPQELVGYLPTDMDLPAQGAVAVSVTLPNGGWAFEAVEKRLSGGSGLTLSIDLIHNGGASAAVLNQLVQVFEISKDCRFDKITINQEVPPRQLKLL